MSGAKSAIDTMTAEDTALRDSMRDDGPEVDLVSESEAPEPEIDLDDAPDAADHTDETDTQRPKMVPHGQFHAANERRKAAEARAVEAEKQRAISEGVVSERLRILTEAAQASIQQATPAVPAIEIPDRETDPIGHFSALLAQANKKIEEQGAILNGFNENQQRVQAHAEMRAWGVAQEEAFMANEPSYLEAANFLKAGRHAELEAGGILNMADRERIIAGDITQIAARSRADGVNFGERVFKLAVARGFKKADAAPAIPPLDPGEPLPDRAARAEAGRQNATTISGSGAPAPRALTPERIAAMPEHEFARYVAKIQDNPAALRELLGN